MLKKEKASVLLDPLFAAKAAAEGSTCSVQRLSDAGRKVEQDVSSASLFIDNTYQKGLCSAADPAGKLSECDCGMPHSCMLPTDSSRKDTGILAAYDCNCLPKDLLTGAAEASIKKGVLMLKPDTRPDRDAPRVAAASSWYTWKWTVPTISSRLVSTGPQISGCIRTCRDRRRARSSITQVMLHRPLWYVATGTMARQQYRNRPGTLHLLRRLYS